MALRYYHAIRITTDNGLGYPVTYSDTSIGLGTGGRFYLITGRPNIVASDGKTLLPVGTHSTWYEGILSSDISGMVVERSCDFIEGGSIAQTSNFAFSIVNTGLFFETLRANAIYLTRCVVEYFYVEENTSTNTFTFDKRWEGEIDDQPFNEKTFEVRCIDNSKSVFKVVPRIAVDSTRFPTAPSDSLGKQIPVAIGYVGYSPLMNVSGAGEKVPLVTYNNQVNTVAALVNYTYDSTTGAVLVYLKTLVTPKFSWKLTGKYLTIVAGGTTQTRKIIQYATWISDDYGVTDENGTAVYLDQRLVDSSGDFISSSGGFPSNSFWRPTNTTGDVWFAQIAPFSNSCVASENPIEAINASGFGAYSLYDYSTDKKAFNNFSDSVESADLTNINKTGFPGLTVIQTGIEIDGAISELFRMIPSSVSLNSLTNVDSVTSLSNGDDLPKLYNLDDTDYYEFQTDIAGSSRKIILNVELPKSDVLKDFDSLYLLLDFKHKGSAAASNNKINIAVDVKDIYGRNTTIFGETNVHTGAITTSFSTVHLLPRKYFNVTPSSPEFTGTPDPETSDNNFYAATAHSIDLSSFLDSFKKGLGYSTFKLTIIHKTNLAVLETYSIRLTEVGFVGRTNINLTSETMYSTLIGETVPTTWGTRKTAGDSITKMGDVVEHLVREYDYGYPIWKASHAYVVGDHIDASPDNGSFYVCTVAGTSSGSAPTFPVTEDSTVTDGGVTWTHGGFYKLSASSFDAFALLRGDGWRLGRTLTEQKNTEEYYKELCQQGFFGMWFGNDGYLRLNPWRDNATPTVTFNASLIIPGTLGSIGLSDIRRVCNDLLVRYDKNAGSDSFNKQAFVTNVDAPAFPAITDYTGTPTAVPGTFSIALVTISPGVYNFEFTTSLAHGLIVGDYVSLTGNTHGYSFGPNEVISVGSTTTFVVAGSLTATTPSTTGTLVSLSTAVFKWKTYVGGVLDYIKAKQLWSQCHQSYLITKTVQKMPENLSNCPWFFDPVGTDPSGNALWEDEIANVGDDHAAINYLTQCAEWLTWQKKQISFECIRTTATSALQLFDPVYFSDAILTNGTSLLGWVSRFRDIPSDGTRPDRFGIEITLNPEQLTTCTTITDTAGAANTITDTAGAANTITDTPC
jgi:hypothetical protein